MSSFDKLILVEETLCHLNIAENEQRKVQVLFLTITQHGSRSKKLNCLEIGVSGANKVTSHCQFAQGVGGGRRPTGELSGHLASLGQLAPSLLCYQPRDLP